MNSEISEATKKAKKTYQKIWSDPNRVHRSGKNISLGWHLGYYEKGILTEKEAMKNMNSYVNRLIDFKNNNYSKVLDAGCGVGATLLFNAEKNPDVNFFGIALGENEIAIAKKIQEEKNLKNANFMVKSFLETGFPEDNFDAVYALESVSVSDKKQEFLHEMNRVLKPGGRIIIVDMFRQKDSYENFLDKSNHYSLKKFEYPLRSTTIDMFKSYLEIEGFKDIKIKNIMKSGNVKYIQLQGLLLTRIFQNAYINLKAQFDEKISKDKSIKYPRFLKEISVIKIIFEIILLFMSQTAYFTISATKQ